MALRGVWGAGTGDGSRVQLLLHAAAIPMALAATPASGRTFCPHRASICNILSVNTRAHSVDTAKISVHKNGCCCCRGYRCSSVCACPSSTMRGCTSGTTSQLHSCSVRFQRQHCADWYSHRTQPAALCVYARAGLTASRRRARTRGILPQRPICGASLRRPFANTRQARTSSNGGCG